MTDPSPPPTATERGRRFFLFPPPDEPGARMKMIVGLLAGMAISGLVWGVLFDRVNGWVLLALIGGKVVTAILCLTAPRSRPLGQGLLASIAVGCWIFLIKLCGSMGGVGG